MGVLPGCGVLLTGNIKGTGFKVMKAQAQRSLWNEFQHGARVCRKTGNFTMYGYKDVVTAKTALAEVMRVYLRTGFSITRLRGLAYLRCKESLLEL